LALLGIGVVAVLFIANNKNEEIVSKKPAISIHVEGENAFLTAEVNCWIGWFLIKLYAIGDRVEKINIKKNRGSLSGKWKKLNALRCLRTLEIPGILTCSLGNPIARIFNLAQDSYYLDDEGFTINRSDLHTARVLVISGYITEMSEKCIRKRNY
jgi:hypothetical protein